VPQSCLFFFGDPPLSLFISRLFSADLPLSRRFLLSSGFLFVVVIEVIEDGGEVRVFIKYFDDLLALLKGNFLSVAAVGHRLALIGVELNVAEQDIGKILDNQPLDL